MSKRQQTIQEQQDKRLKQQIEIEREKKLDRDIEQTHQQRQIKKGMQILRQSGIYEAHQSLMMTLLKNGFPTQGNIYEFSAQEILNQERRQKQNKLKQLTNKFKEREEMKKHLLAMKQQAANMNKKFKQRRNRRMHSPRKGDTSFGKQTQSVMYNANATVHEHSGEDDESGFDRTTMRTELVDQQTFEDFEYGIIHTKFEDYGLESAIDTELGMQEIPSRIGQDSRIIAEVNEEFDDEEELEAQKIRMAVELVWIERDQDGNGSLDPQEAKNFFMSTLKHLDGATHQFDESTFDETFQQIDVEGNGSIAKENMVTYVQKMFESIKEKPQEQKIQPQVQNKQSEKLEELKTQDNQQMEDHAKQIQEAIDLIWEEHDKDGSGFLDKLEAQEFVQHTLQYLDSSRLAEFNGSKFEEGFKKFDKDGNGVIQKAEMAEFVKEVFQNSE